MTKQAKSALLRLAVFLGTVLTAFVLMVLVSPQTQAAATLTATKSDVAASSIYTTFGDTPAFRLTITNSGDADGTVTSLSPTPAGTLDDTGVTLHFWLDDDQDGFVSSGDTDLGADAAFAVNNTKQAFDITDVTVSSGTAEVILITASGTGANTNTFSLGFALAADIVVTDDDNTCAGAFALNNANDLTVSNTAPTLDVSTGSGASDTSVYPTDTGDYVLMDLVFTTGATTGDTVKTISIDPNSSTLNDASDITAVKFYYDADSNDTAAASELLTSSPTTFSANDTETVFTISGDIPIANSETKSILVAFTYNGTSTGSINPRLANRAADVVWASGTADSDTSALSDAQLSVSGGSSSSATPAAAPTDVAVSQNSSGQAVITWTDPTTTGYNKMQILRGMGWLPVNGVAYDTVAKGIETYTDADTTIGDTAKYILRPISGSNTFGELTAEFSITISSTATVAESTTEESTQTQEQTQTQAQTKTRYQEAGVSESEVDSAVGVFTDLAKSAWHAPFITRMKNMAVLAGYPDSTVQPDRTINRAELAKIAAKAFGLASASENFSDVPNDSWFAPFVGALAQADAAWTTTSNYQPAENVSRGEAVWVLLSAAGVDLDSIAAEKLFPDVNTSHRYAAAITYAAQNGIVNGYENGNFGPGDTLTRGQVAKIVTLIKDL